MRIIGRARRPCPLMPRRRPAREHHIRLTPMMQNRAPPRPFQQPNRAAAAFACPANRNHKSSVKYANICADKNRCLENKCPARLRLNSNSHAFAGSKKITASTPQTPVFSRTKTNRINPAFPAHLRRPSTPARPSHWQNRAPRPDARAYQTARRYRTNRATGARNKRRPAH